MKLAVAITGLGAVGPYGVGASALADAWRTAAPEPCPVAGTDTGHRPGGARCALIAENLDLTALLSPAQARRMSPPARFSVAAARLALTDADLGTLDADAHLGTAVVLGTSFGPASVSERLLDQIVRTGPESASPALFTESVASAPAAQIALALGARGANIAITAGEASDLLALAEAANLIATGAAERALVVVVDEMLPLLHALLDRYRALARPDAGGVELARPFDRRRSGALAAEGAVVLVLESEASAAARRAPVRARLRALARAFDPTAPAFDFGTGGAALARTARRGIEAAGVALDSIARVVSGASGALAGDRLEAETLRTLFGPALPPVTAPKGVLGAWGGGSLGAAVLAAGGDRPGPARAFREVDPDLGIEPVGGELWPASGRLLVSSLGSGGAAAWAVLDPGDDNSAGSQEPGTLLAV